MAYVEVLTGNGLTVKKWNKTLFREYVMAAYWSRFSGSNANAAVHIVEDLQKQPGDSVTLGLRTKLQGGIVTGSATGVGNEGTFNLVNEQISVDNVRVLAKIKDRLMTQRRVNFNILMEAKMAIVDASQERYDQEITTELSSTDNGRVRGRYLYGITDSNWNATHATALTAIDNTSDKMSTTMLEIAKRKAQIPINATAKIRPIRVVRKNGKIEWYTAHLHPYAARDLSQDPAWRNAHINIPPQANSNSPIYTGSEYMGSWKGIHVYEYEGLQLLPSTIQVATNLFMGAQAIGVAWAMRSKFSEEFTDHGYQVSYNSGEIRGMERLVFNRDTEEDQGLIHLYSAGVAD